MKKISTPIFIYRSTSIVELHAHQLISDERLRLSIVQKLTR